MGSSMESSLELVMKLTKQDINPCFIQVQSQLRVQVCDQAMDQVLDQL